MYTFLPKLCVAETHVFLAINRTLGFSIRNSFLKKEQKRDINMLRKLWLPNNKGRKAECVRGQTSFTSRNFTPCYFKSNEFSLINDP